MTDNERVARPVPLFTTVELILDVNELVQLLVFVVTNVCVAIELAEAGNDNVSELLIVLEVVQLFVGDGIKDFETVGLNDDITDLLTVTVWLRLCRADLEAIVADDVIDILLPTLALLRPVCVFVIDSVGVQLLVFVVTKVCVAIGLADVATDGDNVPETLLVWLLTPLVETVTELVCKGLATNVLETVGLCEAIPEYEYESDPVLELVQLFVGDGMKDFETVGLNDRKTDPLTLTVWVDVLAGLFVPKDADGEMVELLAKLVETDPVIVRVGVDNTV